MTTTEQVSGLLPPVISQGAAPFPGHVSRGNAVHALITGASGFIGMQLARHLLNEGKQIRIYVRRAATVTRLQQQGAQVVTGDLDDIQSLTRAIEGAQTVYHLAGLTSSTQAKRMMHVNGEGTRNVAKACALQSQPPVLVHVSTIAAAGPTSREGLKRESDLPSPISIYGRSKLAGEHAVAKYAQEVPTTIIRPAIVYGPHNRDMLPIFRTIQYLRFHPVSGWKTPPLSFIYIDDTLDVLRRAAIHGSRLPPPCGNVAEQLTAGRGVYFASGPEHPSYADLGGLLRKLLDRPHAPIVYLPHPLPWLFASIHELTLRLKGISDTFNRDKIQESKAESWACSSDLAHRDLGFVASCPLVERLKVTIDWYHENGWL
jgi:nucleoside-diphosphate-sugar epimerase